MKQFSCQSGDCPADYEVVIVGSGFSGLGMAIRLKQSGQHSFVVLEQADEVGGTWRDNHYPGCACDVQSHLYSFSFEPNPDWSRMYASQPEILAYQRHCADKYRIRPHIRFNAAVQSACWDDEQGLWRVRTGAGETLTARSMVSAIGGLSRPAYPAIRGLNRFQGPAFHSQQWDHGCDLRGKRVAVIGTGASAIQFVPQIAPRVKELKLFQRTAPWVLPKPDRAISRRERLLFRLLPQTQRAVRKAIYWHLETTAAGFTINPRLMKLAERWGRQHIRRHIQDPALRARVTPDFTPGCKRILLSNDYYPALARDNVEVVCDGIQEVRAHSIVTADGVEHEVDVLIFGTGFQATDPIGPLELRGRNGLNLRDYFSARGTQAYLGTMMSGFPNLFLLLGPNTGLGHNSIIYMIESQVQLVLDTLRTMRRRGLRSVEPRPDRQAAYNEELQDRLAGTVWSQGGCKSWYMDETGRNVTLWPGFTWQFRRLTRRFQIEAYRVEPAADPQELPDQGRRLGLAAGTG